MQGLILGFGRSSYARSVKRIVFLSVLIFLSDSPADFELKCGRNRHVPPIKESMQIASQENAVRDFVRSTVSERSDMTGFKNRQNTFPAYRASAVVGIRHNNSESRLAKSRLNQDG